MSEISNKSENKADALWQMRKGPWLKTGEILILLALLLFALALFYYPRMRPPSSSVVAKLYLDDILIEEIELQKGLRREIRLPGKPQLLLLLEADGCIRFLRSDCPDQICVHSGPLSRAGQFAACLPRGVILLLENRQEKDAPNEPDLILSPGQVPGAEDSAPSRPWSSR